jgi:hypothetical protein
MNDVDKCFHCDAAPSRWYVKESFFHYVNILTNEGYNIKTEGGYKIFGLCHHHRLQYATPTPRSWNVKEYDDKEIVIVMDVMNS